MPRQDHDDLNGSPTKREHPSDTPRRPTKPRTAIGEALHVHGEAVDHVEALYLQAHGEVTDETEAAEAARDVSARDALEHVARYLAWVGDQEAAVKRERERLADVDARLSKRREWAEGKAVALAESIDPERTKHQVGTRVVKLQRTAAVVTGEGFDVAQLPAAWTREIAEVPAVPARPALDKTAAKADMLLGYREGEPPCEGWYDVEGHGRMWLSQALGDWWISRRPEDENASSLSNFDLSIEPEPGMDTLRWKPSPPGVELVRRVHVKVG